MTDTPTRPKPPSASRIKEIRAANSNRKHPQLPGWYHMAILDLLAALDAAVAERDELRAVVHADDFGAPTCLQQMFIDRTRERDAARTALADTAAPEKAP